MSFIIRGNISLEDTQYGIEDLTVEAYDADLFTDDLLGRAKNGSRSGYQ